MINLLLKETAASSRFKRSLPIFIAIASLIGAQIACAQETPEPERVINVKARKNPGDLDYRFFFKGQQEALSYMAPEPRLLDFVFRISFVELSENARDSYVPPPHAVTVVSESVEEEVPVRRGGYFVLPDLPKAYEEDGTIMFKEQSKRRSINVLYQLRLGPEQRLSYADFGKALAEFKAMQKRIPIYKLKFVHVKFAKAEGLRACFREPGGTVTVDGGPIAATTGLCTELTFDPARASGGEIVFDGPLDIVLVGEVGKEGR